MRILIANDDGIDAVGINVLAEVFSKDNDIIMVAPESERSAFGHSISIHNDITYKRVDRGGIEAYSVSGTPADCVKLGLLHILKDNPPDLVLSGINNGPNLGSDIMYSGTVSAALEGAYLGVRSVAVSLSHWDEPREKFVAAAAFMKETLPKLLSVKLPLTTVLNVNYPATAPFCGVRVTKAGINIYNDAFVVSSTDKNAVRLTGVPVSHDRNNADCDVELCAKGFATVTPIHLDRNDYVSLHILRDKVRFE